MAGHHSVGAGEYDPTIRTFVPGYDEMQSAVVRWLGDHIRPGGFVVDLGAGTGGLSMAILGMQRYGISAADAETHFAQWAAHEDRYLPLTTELEAIGAAGFARPECFWKLGALTVFGGFRDGRRA